MVANAEHAADGSCEQEDGRTRFKRAAWWTLGIALAMGVAAAIAVPTYLFVLRRPEPGHRSSPCQGFVPPARELQGARIAKLPGGRRPNFIYILVDDMGYDDLRLHHPRAGRHQYVTTPNLDRLVQEAIEFPNFYTTPMCSTSRAELLTGRYYPRTGSMYINTGWDFLNVNESTAARVMRGAGYRTAVFGKWHNGRTAGYMPMDVGFQEAFLPTPYVHLDNKMTVNGRPVQTKGWMEEALMGFAVDWLKQRKADGKPFFMFYPSFSVHAGWVRDSSSGPRYQRPAPPELLAKYRSLPGLAESTAGLYAMLEHIDTQVGRLLQFLDKSGLSSSTYVMVSGDNGPALFRDEAAAAPKDLRMPSNMQGSKHDVLEGGIRNFLAVRGPGVAAGAVSNQLLALLDVLPTMADLAGVKNAPHPSWDGISFANLLDGGGPTPQQRERTYVTMSTNCIEDDFVPLLGPDRRTLKPQPLLNFTTGGVSGAGFKRCVGVRYRDYKWVADARRAKGQGRKVTAGGLSVPSGLYRFGGNGTSHVELRCSEVSLKEPQVAAKLERAADAWFADMLSSPWSFEKATFFVGYDGRPSVNVVADGAAERTPRHVRVLPMGLEGFVAPGDAASYRLRVLAAGKYRVSLFYQSRHAANFTLLVGAYRDVRDKTPTAMRLAGRLPASPKGRNQLALGALDLPATPPGVTWEVRLEMAWNEKPGLPAIEALDLLVFERQGKAPGGPPQLYEPDEQEGVKAWKDAHGYQYVQGGR